MEVEVFKTYAKKYHRLTKNKRKNLVFIVVPVVELVVVVLETYLEIVLQIYLSHVSSGPKLKKPDGSF